jgi:oligopeptidase A
MAEYITFDIDKIAHYHQIEQVIQQATDIIEFNKKNIDALTSFDELILPIEKIEFKLEQQWSLLDHLQNVNNCQETREQHQKTLALISDFQTHYALDQNLMKVYEKALQQKDLNDDQRILIDHSLINFKLAGVLLDEEKKQRIFSINQETTSLSEKFSNHLLDTTEKWTMDVTLEELEGLSAAQLNYLAQIALEHESSSPYMLNLSSPCYQMILTNCKNSVLRKKLYEAYAHRASQYDGHGLAYNNASVVQDLLVLRKEEANLLGYDSYRDYVLQKRFAQTAEDVSIFLKEFVQAVQPAAKADLHKLKVLAQQDGLVELAPWDIAFYSEELKKQTLNINDEEIRQYFQLDHVLKTMLDEFGQIYGFIVKPADYPTWHEDVFTINLIDPTTLKLIGTLYIDLYARPGKRQGAWMSGALSKIDYKDWQGLPVAYIVCNFRKDTAVTLAFDDVQTLFHEFGHSLHHLLTERTLPSIAGIHQVPWDIVELPSQLNEQWCFNRDFLKKLSCHLETGEPLSAEFIDNLIATRQFLASLFLLRQLEFATFDWEIHGEELIDDVVVYWHNLRNKIAVIPTIPTHSFPLGFSHIFDGGYAAGYYSYLWADAYVYQVFDKMMEYEHKKDAGEAFKANFLAIGPSLSLKESLHAFLGKEQSVLPLLKAYGLHSEQNL